MPVVLLAGCWHLLMSCLSRGGVHQDALILKKKNSTLSLIVKRRENLLTFPPSFSSFDKSFIKTWNSNKPRDQRRQIRSQTRLIWDACACFFFFLFFFVSFVFHSVIGRIASGLTSVRSDHLHQKMRELIKLSDVRKKIACWRLFLLSFVCVRQWLSSRLLLGDEWWQEVCKISEVGEMKRRLDQNTTKKLLKEEISDSRIDCFVYTRQVLASYFIIKLIRYSSGLRWRNLFIQFLKSKKVNK